VSELSTKPYLIRAIYEWCSDSGYRPYIAVVVDEHTQVPFEFVRNGEIVLNVSAEATSHLVIGNDMVEFEARFNRVARNVSVPIANVTAIYAAENGHGMAFEVPKALAIVEPKAPRTELREVPTEGAGADAADVGSAPEGEAVEPAPVELSTVRSTRRRSSPKAASAPAKSDAAPRGMTLVPGGSGSQSAPVPAAASPGRDGPSDTEPAAGSNESSDGDDPSPSSPPGSKGGRPRLTRVK
jgi:stringent starvation protein B